MKYFLLSTKCFGHMIGIWMKISIFKKCAKSCKFKTKNKTTVYCREWPLRLYSRRPSNRHKKYFFDVKTTSTGEPSRFGVATWLSAHWKKMARSALDAVGISEINTFKTTISKSGYSIPEHTWKCSRITELEERHSYVCGMKWNTLLKTGSGDRP